MRTPRVAVLGASGYTGAEALRLLAAHPAEVTAIGAGTAAGRPVSDLYPHLLPYEARRFEAPTPEQVADVADAAILALPHEESASLAPVLAEAGVRVVDLSGAFRLAADAYPRWYGFEHPHPAWLDKAVYGLPEVAAGEISEADLVAGPGCYPTAVLLALVPLLEEALVDPVGIVIDAKSGVSGAGRTPTDATHFAAVEGGVHPYAAAGHRHVPEIESVLGQAADAAVDVTFLPHLVPTVRGILATCYLRPAPGTTAESLAAALADVHADHPFVRVLAPGDLPDSKRVSGSNHCEVGVVVDDAGTAIVVAALDNLVKGAAGQAVQCLNLMFDLPETTGLDLLAVAP